MHLHSKIPPVQIYRSREKKDLINFSLPYFTQSCMLQQQQVIPVNEVVDRTTGEERRKQKTSIFNTGSLRVVCVDTGQNFTEF